MQIVLSPIASDHTTSVSVQGLVVMVDDVTVDLSVIPEGGDAIAAEDSPLVGTVTRDRCVVKFYYDSAAAIPNQSTDWADYTFDVSSGEVPNPIVWRNDV